MKNKTAISCWYIKKGEIDIAFDRYAPLKSMENSLKVKRNICQKRLLRRLHINRLGGIYLQGYRKYTDSTYGVISP